MWDEKENLISLNQPVNNNGEQLPEWVGNQPAWVKQALGYFVEPQQQAPITITRVELRDLDPRFLPRVRGARIYQEGETRQA